MTAPNKTPEIKDAPRSGGMFVTVPRQDQDPLTKNRGKNPPLIDRLKKSGLDPQKLLDIARPGSATKSTTSLRHRLILIGFLLFVALPSAAFSAYMIFWASDQYHSTTAFAVRSANQAAATDILGMMLDSGSESPTSNSYIVNDYLQSQAIIEDLSHTIDLEAIFNRDQADWLFRLGTDLPIEDKIDYWNRMVDINFDATSGVIYVEVRTFHPDDSVTLATAILQRSEVLVNKLSEVNRRQSVRFAEETVARAEARLKVIRRQMLAYRDGTQEVSPEDNAKIAMEMISALDQQVVAKQAEMKTLATYLNSDSPRIRLLYEEINALESQITTERQRLGGGTSGDNGTSANDNRLAVRISDYSDLKLEEEFANQFYTTALAGLEKARQDADQKHMYLATFIKPTLSQQAQYPQRFLYSFAFFLMLAGFWTVVVLMYYNIRDRT
ncbi:MAG: hypothetical protein ABJQ45_12215 [Parasphingorhabdus sp.]|uniref:hypothetical protein n=1 Tax=Parasphingorhabdus sp. TaxID=2709688 RepID=UPI00329967F9